jgi:hypothetical protein
VLCTYILTYVREALFFGSVPDTEPNNHIVQIINFPLKLFLSSQKMPRGKDKISMRPALIKLTRS